MDAEGRARVRAEVSLAVRVAVSGVVEGIDVEGIAGDGPAGLAGLVGASLRSGFGRRAAATLPDDAARRTLLGTLLDDLPGAHHVSGYALARGGVTAAAGAGLGVHAHFRDSWSGDGHEVALHEYSIEAAVDGDGCIYRVEVDPRVLAWDACPGAVASASRMVGVAVVDLPARVRAELAGPSTCTHLNSMLRSLADVSATAPKRVSG